MGVLKKFLNSFSSLVARIHVCSWRKVVFPIADFRLLARGRLGPEMEISVFFSIEDYFNKGKTVGVSIAKLEGFAE